MGCWSENCAISGLELHYGCEIYVGLLGPTRDDYEGYEFVVPPMRGTYDDYGGIELTESSRIYGLEAGTEWDCREDKRGDVVYFHAGIVDKLDALIPEFTYKYANLGEDVDSTVAKLHEILTIAKPDFVSTDTSEEKVNLAIAYMVLGSASGFGDVYKIAGKILDGDDTIEEFLKLHRRVRILKRAEKELRTMIVSGISGPQHRGEVALKQMCEWTLEEIKSRKDEDEEGA